MSASARSVPIAPPSATPQVGDNSALHEETYPADQKADVKAWLSLHGVKGLPPSGDCWDLHDAVGVPPAPGLLCETWDKREDRLTARVLRLEGKALRGVFSRPVKTTNGWLNLTVVVAPGGAALSLQQSSHGDCVCALRAYEEEARAGYPAIFGKALSQGCHARGEYTWSTDHYEGPKWTPPSPPCPGEEELR